LGLRSYQPLAGSRPDRRPPAGPGPAPPCAPRRYQAAASPKGLPTSVTTALASVRLTTRLSCGA